MPKTEWVSWTGFVKTRKTGNTMKRNGKWSKGKYLTFSIAIPSDQAKMLRLVPGTMLLIKATPHPKEDWRR